MDSFKALNQDQMVKALNEWLRRYIEEPERYAREFEMVNEFLADEAEGQEPSYGKTGAAYMLQLSEEIENPPVQAPSAPDA